MEKRKRWHFYLILTVLLLTLYNVLPTLFYYTKPLQKPVGPQEATKVAQGIIARVNDLEQFTLDWLQAQCKNLGLKPRAISLDVEDPRLAHLHFRSVKDATFFSKTLDRAGSLIPFVPAQLSTLAPAESREKEVIVQRHIGLHLNPRHPENYFHYVPKRDAEGHLSSAYHALIEDRVLQLAMELGGESRVARTLNELVADTSDSANDEALLPLAAQLVEYTRAFGEQDPIARRYYATWVRGARSLDSEVIVAKMEKMAEKRQAQIERIDQEQKQLQQESQFLSPLRQQQRETLSAQERLLKTAAALIKKNRRFFEEGPSAFTKEALQEELRSTLRINLEGRDPFIAAIELDSRREEILLHLYPEIATLRRQTPTTEEKALYLEKVNQFLFNEIATLGRALDETIAPSLEAFVISLNQLANSTGLLTLNIGALAKEQSLAVQYLLKKNWQPKDPELSANNYPIYSWSQYQELSPQERKLGLVLYAPVMDLEPESGFRSGSFYVIARGLNTIGQKYQDLSDTVEKERFEKDFRTLHELLRRNGFIAYPAHAAGLPREYRGDYIFELDDYYSYLLAATREEFTIKASKRFATLELTTVGQRLATLNKIETSMHEDLLKWRDEYRTARVSLDPTARFDVPPPTKNVLWDNIKLSTRKYFRGDERKVLKWGLDLSGGKTVRLGLKDQNGQSITGEQELHQAVNELYQRVNRLGVSEVSIRIEGENIVLDFPGSQGLAASELIQASAMYFHLVNEKFGPLNPSLREATENFLEEVWNEAVVTNRTDIESLNAIAWSHLGGDPEQPGVFYPLTSHAQRLYQEGLRFASPGGASRSGQFDDTLSSIGRFRGEDFSSWYGQTHPLVIVFHNYALEGSSLIDIHTGYDPSEGNVLSFGVKGSSLSRTGEKSNPREILYAWTSQFSEEKIAGTPKEELSQGRGWRMAVVLNGTIISAPTLNSPLRDSARISGHFTQREINQLAASLKAGSLSFTPVILSEENVSPDLGKEQRMQGIFASLLGLTFVIVAMCLYYRFSGLVASVAVLVNLLIIWATLQNLGAALTLPGIAGIILAVGMSVDANVLVFERIREEFALHRKLAAAIQAGYRKAFTAIIDSNLTTILAALILLNFDSGPIKGFALTLIIGIVSSMFTSLFMTRFFFAGWVQNPEHKQLNMRQLFKETHFDFIGKAKTVMVLSLALLLVGGFFLVKERKTLLGMDFTGGYALTVELQSESSSGRAETPRTAVEHALLVAGAAKSDLHIQELNRPTHLRIQLGMSMENPGKPFYQIDTRAAAQNTLLPYQESPRMVWIVEALERAGLKITPQSLATLHLNWTEMSGQLSEAMRNQAIAGLAIALLGILIYISFRFEFKYAISATIGLVHDLLITLGLLALCHLFFEEIRMDLQVIAALMTIIGYSLNDTIIIFDRIREDQRLSHKTPLPDLINHALNATLSRTVMTSGTTLLVLLALVFFGGASIFNFSLIMTLGIAIGTLSSLYVAAPLLLYFHKRERSDRTAISSKVTTI